MLEGIEAFPSLGRGGKAPRLVCGSVSVDSDSRKTLPDRLHVALRSPRFRVLLLLASGLALLVLLRWRESLGNVVLPARAGEVARIAVLARRLGGRAGVWARLVGSVVAYRLLDLLPSLVLIVYVLVSAPIPHWALRSLALVAVLGLALLAIGLASARRHERPLVEARGRFRLLATLAREGLGILRAPLPAATATLYQSVAWLSQLLAVFATLRAFGLALPLSAAALVLALVNLAILFPLWPGNVGLLQATVALPLAAYAVDYGHGVAFGVGMQAIEASVGLSLGLFFLAREGLSVAVLKRVPDAGEPSLSARPVPLELEDG